MILSFFLKNHSHPLPSMWASTNPKIKNIKQDQQIKCGSSLDTIAAQCTLKK